MGSRSKLDTKTEVVLINASAAAIAFPTDATFGASIAATERDDVQKNTVGAWKNPGQGGGRIDAAVFFEGSAAITFSAGLGLYGYRVDTAKWYLLGQLNGGTAIPILGANTGWSTIVESVGMFDRLAIGPLAAANVNIAGGNATVRATQIRVTEDLWS